MANEYNDDEIIAALIAGGILVAGMGIGTYLFLKTFGSYKKGDVIDNPKLIKLSDLNEKYSTSWNQPPTISQNNNNCEIHGNSEKCQRELSSGMCDNCLECNNIGDEKLRWCKPCQDEYEWDEWWWDG
jgi:hypothetical protein